LSQARARTDRAERRPVSAATAFRAFAATTLPVFEAAAHDPDLPAELLPPDWPGDQVAATLSRAFRVFAPMIAEYLAAITRDQASRRG
jgi:DNA-binding transcriptional regulator PaaX